MSRAFAYEAGGQPRAVPERGRRDRLSCGALTHRGTPCRRPAVNGGPCAWHSRTRKPEPRSWPLARRWRLMELIERGWNDERIGRELGCSAEAANLARKRYGIKPKSRTCLTARAVAAKLGLGCAKTVTRWVEAGWLRGQRGWDVGNNRAWIVREDALLDFLADPAHFHRYDPARIPDRVLRQWAERQRGGERFLSQSEAVAWLAEHRGIHITRGGLAQWLDKGWLPFVRNGRANRVIRERDLADVELPRFGAGALKTSWEPCARCGDPDGPIRKRCVTPGRCRGDRYGFAGLVCTRCYRRLRTEFERRLTWEPLGEDEWNRLRTEHERRAA